MGRVDELIALLPRGIASEPGADPFLRGILTGVAQVEAYHNAKVAAVPGLLDASEIPDELVPHLAAIVGLGTELPAANSLTVAELRRLIPVAVALWKKKGTRASWRDVVLFLQGARSLIFDWFHHRLILGSSLELHLLPVPSTSPGGAYDVPEYVSDVWVADTTGAGLDLDVLARWLGVMSAANERINLFEALFIEDLRVGTVLWEIETTANVPPDGLRLDLTMADGSAGGLQSTSGNTFVIDPSVPFPADTTSGQHVFVLLAIEGEGEVILFSADDLGDDSYTVVITNDNGSGNAEAELFKYVAGTPTSLVVWTLPQVLVDLWGYRWRFELFRPNATDTEIRAQWEAVVLGSHVDVGSAHTDGRMGFRGGPAGSDRAILQTALIWRPTPTRVRVGLDP